ncbi:MAG: methyltransferase family protein, partial [Candidatus Hodarchaeota archaeon]
MKFFISHMLNSTLVRIFIIISFFFFGYNLTYIILYKKSHKKNQNNNEINNRLKNTRTFAKIGIHLINIFIFLCCLNIFIYEYWRLIFPKIDLLVISDILQIVGFTLIIGGNIVLLLAYRKLGVQWSYPIDGTKKKKELVTTGIYGRVRHPIYLSFNIFCIGYNLLLLDWFLLTLYIIGAIGLYVQAIDEEKILIEYFGN